MRPEDFKTGVRADGTASYLELNAIPPPLSSRGRGWEGIIVERENYVPFDNGEVVYDEHLLCFVLDNNVHLSYVVEGRRHEGRYNDGDVFLSPGGLPIHWHLDDPSQGLLVILDPGTIRRTAQSMTDGDPRKVHLIEQPRMNDPFINRIGLALQAELEGAGMGERLYVESLRNLLAVHLLRHCSSLSLRPEPPRDRGLTSSRLRRAIEAIEDHLETGISLNELAETAGASVSHFEVLFKRSTGASPHQYLLRRRVERAKELLRREDLSLAQIAARAGFCDQSHLARHFKRIVGTTPGGYRTGR